MNKKQKTLLKRICCAIMVAFCLFKVCTVWVSLLYLVSISLITFFVKLFLESLFWIVLALFCLLTGFVNMK